MDVTIKVVDLLKDSSSKWAIAGNVAEVLSGVNVQPSHLEILTSKKGCDEISTKLEPYVTAKAAIIEKKLSRPAEVDLKHYPVSIRAYTSQFQIDETQLDVYGDLQIRVGEWQWGDPLDYQPDYVYTVGGKVPVVPLKLKNELYMGLGWEDRVRKIREAMIRRHHGLG